MSTIDVEMCIFSTDPISWTIQISKSICFEILDATKNDNVCLFRLLPAVITHTHKKSVAPTRPTKIFNEVVARVTKHTGNPTQINITVTYTTTAT